jgi:hypothetical protein
MEQGLAVIGAMLIATFSLPFWPLAALPQSMASKFILLILLFLLGLALLHPRILGPIIRWAAFRLHKPELNWNFEYKTIIKFVFIYALAAFFAGLALVAVMAGLGEFKTTEFDIHHRKQRSGLGDRVSKFYHSERSGGERGSAHSSLGPGLSPAHCHCGQPSVQGCLHFGRICSSSIFPGFQAHSISRGALN